MQWRRKGDIWLFQTRPQNRNANKNGAKNGEGKTKKKQFKKEYSEVSYVSGPLMFLENAPDLAYNAIVSIKDGNGRIRGGQVIDVSEKVTTLQVFEDPRGIDLSSTTVTLVEDVARLRRLQRDDRAAL